MTEYPHLANFSSREGYWHKRDIFRPVIQDILTKLKPETMLEIGFNIGYSASMWLEFDPDQKLKLTSVDIGIHKDTLKAAEAVKNLHPERFNFILSDSKKVKPQIEDKIFDVAFIDGDHSATGVASDIRLCLDLKIPYLIFDDWHVPDSQGREMNAIRGICEDTFKTKITKIKVYDLEGIVPPSSKVALYRNDTVNSKENYFKRQISLLSPKS
jgi:cephalosporin hydroxylase